MPEKNPVQPTPTVKHHLITALIAAGIIVVIALFIWIPFKLIPELFSNGSNYVATTLTSTLVPATSTSQTAGTSNGIAATNQNQAPNTSASAPRTTYAATPIAPAYYGLPDLSISLIATGIIDPASGQFVQTSYAGANDLVAIKFQVKNIGTNVSGPWTLRMNMPSRTTPYDDSYQPSIRPGDAIEYVASFDSPIAQGVNTAYLTVDPLSAMRELSKANNQLVVPLNISGTTYSYNNNYAYGVGNTVPTQFGTLYSWSSLSVNCYANPQTIYPGSAVTWSATASGGNGYYTYAWSGSDGLSDTGPFVTHTYYSSGEKIAVVTVTSNGQSISKTCNAYVY